MLESLKNMFHHLHHSSSDDDEEENEEEFNKDSLHHKEDFHSETLIDEKKQIIWSILKQVAVGSEIKHIQLPTFLLQPRSFLEKLTDSFAHPQLLFDMRDIDNSEERFIQIIRFFISGWHVRTKGVKNPLNPAIGEVFQCSWKTSDKEISSFPPSSLGELKESDTFVGNGIPSKLPPISEDDHNSHFIAEQVSHHPPKTAYCYYNMGKGILYSGNITPGYVKFYGSSAGTSLDGHLNIKIILKDGTEENYEISLPGILIRGILYGNLTLEIVGKSMIACKETGYRSIIDFKSKGLFSGSYNEIQGNIWKFSEDPSHMISGHWDTITNIKNLQTEETTILFDVDKHKAIPKTVPSLEFMEPYESQKYWQGVILGIEKGDDNKALTEKRKLEQYQRDLEMERAQKGQKWRPSLFYFDNNSDKWIYRQESNIYNNIKEKAALKFFNNKKL